MRIVVIGATGNIGTALLESLAEQGGEADVVCVARRLPVEPATKLHRISLTWMAADIASDPLDEVLDSADVVVNLAWLFHPSHHAQQTWRNNVGGALRILEAVRRCAVPRLVVSSSVAAYSARVDLAPVDEGWPTHGASSAPYVREKSYLERALDAFELRRHLRCGCPSAGSGLGLRLQALGE